MGLNNSAWNKPLLVVVSFELMSQTRETVIPCLSPHTLGVQMTRVAPGACVKTMEGPLHVSAGSSLTRNFPSLQFQKDTKDAQELLKKVDTDLDQKFSPEFKDRYQLESLLRELDVSVCRQRRQQQEPLCPWHWYRDVPARVGTWPSFLHGEQPGRAAASPCPAFPQLFLPPWLEIASPLAT